MEELGTQLGDVLPDRQEPLCFESARVSQASFMIKMT